jgi:hypothetical protein
MMQAVWREPVHNAWSSPGVLQDLERADVESFLFFSFSSSFLGVGGGQQVTSANPSNRCHASKLHREWCCFMLMLVQASYFHIG